MFKPWKCGSCGRVNDPCYIHCCRCSENKPYMKYDTHDNKTVCKICGENISRRHNKSSTSHVKSVCTKHLIEKFHAD